LPSEFVGYRILPLEICLTVGGAGVMIAATPDAQQE